MNNSKFFKIPNEYQDAKCRIRIDGQAGQVLNVIERFTFGWNKAEAMITLRTFRKNTGLDDSHIIRSRNKLFKMGLITSSNLTRGKGTTLQGNKRLLKYRIQKDYTKWKPLPYRVTTLQGNKATTLQGNKPLPYRATSTPNNKNINVKDILFKDRKIDKIKQLKIRKKELQVDLKEKNQFDNKKFLIKGIKEIEKQLKKLEVKKG